MDPFLAPFLRWGERWLASAPPGLPVVASATALAVAAFALLVRNLLRDTAALGVVGLTGVVMVSLLVLQTAALQLAHQKRIREMG